jgi:predicted ATP-grasp superfamily ATP-dependent carboligase
MSALQRQPTLNMDAGPDRRTSVLVLDGNENQAVACVRSLGAAGYDVHVGADTAWSKAGWSRFCRGRFRYPGPQQDSHAFVAGVAAEVRRLRGAVVLPMTERSTLPLSQHRQELMAAGARLVLPSHDTVVAAFDKAHTTKLAQSLGIPVPWTVEIGDYVEARRVALEARYPVVLKPRSSEEVGFSGRPKATGAPLYARNPHEFMVAYRTLARRCRAMLAQQYVEGAGVGYFALMRHGELRAEFAHRRLRDVRPTGSGSSLRESVSVDRVLRRHALHLLQALGWHGVAMVEFRRGRDGTPVFLEVNGRLWNSLALATSAGTDFPRLLAELAVHGDVEPPPPHRPGVRCRWMLGDLRHVLEVLQGPPRAFPGRFPGRLRTLGAVLRPTLGTHHDNFRLDDPLPELGDWLHFALRRLPALRRARAHTGKELHVERRYSHP